METAIVFMIGAAAVVSFVLYLAKSLKKNNACNCSSKNCSSGNPDCESKP